MISRRNILFIFVCCGTLLLVAPLSGQAALFPTCNPVATGSTFINSVYEPCGVEHLIQLAVNVYNFLLGFAAVILLLMLVWGGFQMIIGFATGDPEEKYKEGKSTIVHAIGGFAIVVAAYVIVNTVLVFLGVDSGSGVGEILKGLRLVQ